MSAYSHYVYYLQDEWTHFSLGVLTDFALGLLEHFENFCTISSLHMSQNISLPPNCMLLKY